MVDLINYIYYLCSMEQKSMDSIRAFNRYYTKILGIMNRCYLGSEFGFPEVRIIQNLYLYPNQTAKSISCHLNMDKGMLSRMLNNLRKKGYLQQENDKDDARARIINLTQKGIEAFHKLNEAATASVNEMLGHLSDTEIQELIQHMNSIYQLIEQKSNLEF